MEQTLQGKGYKNYKASNQMNEIKGHNAQQINKRMQKGMD